MQTPSMQRPSVRHSVEAVQADPLGAVVDSQAPETQTPLKTHGSDPPSQNVPSARAVPRQTPSRQVPSAMHPPPSHGMPSAGSMPQTPSLQTAMPHTASGQRQPQAPQLRVSFATRVQRPAQQAEPRAHSSSSKQRMSCRFGWPGLGAAPQRPSSSLQTPEQHCSSDEHDASLSAGMQQRNPPSATKRQAEPSQQPKGAV